MKQLLTTLLSICFIVFLVDAVFVFIDETFITAFGWYGFTGFRLLYALLSLLLCGLTYVAMGLTPMIPKRIFLPVTLYGPLSTLLMLPVMIFWFPHAQLVQWFLAVGQLVLAVGLLYHFQGQFKPRWPWNLEAKLTGRPFSWLNLSLFAFINVLVVPVALAFYLMTCASTAVSHYTAGTLNLDRQGLRVQVRKYVRPDGHTLLMVPMVHVGDRDFYQQVAQSFPSNSVILLEGISDEHHLLTNRISYKRVAKSLGLTEQVRVFAPDHGLKVHADVDVSQFSPETLEFLKLTTLIQKEGLNPQTLPQITQYRQPDDLYEKLFGDILHMRNRHLLDEIEQRLKKSDYLVVPWGAAHMPGLISEIEKSGFQLESTQDFQVIRFGHRNLDAPVPAATDLVETNLSEAVSSGSNAPAPPVSSAP